MSVTPQLLADLRRDEGFRQSIYQDSLGFDSWGFGWCIDKRKNPTIPRAVAELALQLEAGGIWLSLIHRFPWIQTQPEDVQRALGNMAYNLGAEGVAQFSMMMAALQRGDRESAALNCLDSKWAKQVGERAERIADLIRGHAKEGGD